MNFQNELKNIFDKYSIINKKIEWVKPIKDKTIKYDLIVKDLEGRTIKEIAWGLSLPECLTLSKTMGKSKLIRESEGLYSLQYVKIERGLYDDKTRV